MVHMTVNNCEIPVPDGTAYILMYIVDLLPNHGMNVYWYNCAYVMYRNITSIITRCQLDETDNNASRELQQNVSLHTVACLGGVAVPNIFIKGGHPIKKILALKNN